MGKGSNTTSTTQNSTYTPTGAPAIQTALTTAQNAAATPYQAYGGELTAGVNQEQQSGIAGINSAAGLAQPYYNTAQQYATAAGQPLTQAQIQQYQNPYTQSVVDATQAQFNNQNQQQQSSLLGNAAAQGALGGDRSAVAQANLAGQQSAAQAPVIAGLYNQSYAQGLATAQQQQQQQGTAAGILGGLGTGAQAAGLSGAGAQIGAGTLQQQTQQAQDTSAYQQFLNQLAYPFQTSQFLTQATAGLAPAEGGTTNAAGTTTGPTPSPLGQIIGGIATAASFLPSDERVKENVERIGKLFDGSNIYRFNYKGDRTTRVGLIAQEVEKKDPGAVAERGDGVKMVDHHRATDEAAHRQRFAGGGLALPYGGSGYVPQVASIAAAPTVMPQLPSMGGGQQQQPDQTKGILDSLGSIGKSLKNSSVFSPGLGDDGLGNMNDYSWDGGTPLEGGADIGGIGGGIGMAARGGRINLASGGSAMPYGGGLGYVPVSDKVQVAINPASLVTGAPTLGGSSPAASTGDAGTDPAAPPADQKAFTAAARGGAIRGYDDGGLVPSQDDPSGFDSVPPAPFASYYDPASPVAGGVNVPLNLPQSAGFEPKPDTTIPTPADSGMAAITQGVPLGALPGAVGFDSPVPPTDQPSPMSAAQIGNGAPLGPIPQSQGFDAPAPVASAADVPLPPVRPITGTTPISNETATNRATPTAGYAGNMDRIAAAHRLTESSNNYGALGPVNPNPKSDYYGDRAYGAYQVMGKNIPVWTKEILGRSMTPQEFLNNPEAQDAVYKAKMGQYVNQYGLDGALDKWLGSGKQDFTGTTHDKYREMFRTAMGQVGDDGNIPSNARTAQRNGNNTDAPVPEQSWADRHGLSNPFAQSLTPQSGAKTGANSDSDSPSWWPFGKMSDATKQQLMATGFGMMASKSPFPGVALGEGGLQGITVAQKAQELSRQADLARSTIAGQTAETTGKNIANQAAQDSLEAYRGIRANPLFNGSATGRVNPTSPTAAGPGQASSPAGQPSSAAPALSSAAQTNLSNQPITEASMANTTKNVATVRNTVAGPIAYSASGQPLENLAVTRAKSQVLINSGVPAMMADGIKMQDHVDTVIKGGMQLMSDGSVGPISGAAETSARAAGIKTGAEAEAKAPYEILAAAARESGRPIAVKPNDAVVTGGQVNPLQSNVMNWAASRLPGFVAPGNQPAPAAADSGSPVPTATATPPPGQSMAPALGVPAGSPGTSQFTPHLIRNPDGSIASSVTPGVEAIQKDAATGYEKAADTARASQNMKYRLNLVEHDLEKLNDGGPSYWNSGAGANTRAEFAKTINSYAGMFGMKEPFDTSKVAAWEDLTKESTQLGFATARTLGAREAMQIVQQAITANPGMANTPQGARLVLNSIRYAAKSDTDYYNFATKYAQEHGGDLIGAQTEFYKQNPPSQYSAAALAAGNAPAHVANLKAHPETAPQFDAKYGKGVSAIILSE